MSNKELDIAMGVRPTVPVENPDEALKATVSSSKRRQIERSEELEEVTHDAKVAEAKKKKTTAEAGTEQAAQGASSGFQVTGGVNLGTIDYQEQQRKTEAENERLRNEAQQSANSAAEENTRLKEEAHVKDLTILENSFKYEMANLTKLIAAGQANQKTLVDQFNEVKVAAETLGIANPQVAGDLTIQVQMKKLDMDFQMQMHQMTRADAESDRDFQLRIRELDDKRADRQEELRAQREKYAALSNIPATVGAAFAQGLMAGPESPASEPAPVQHKAPKGKKLTAGYGETGAVPCPTEGCTGELGVGPTARSATCAVCGLQVPINRVQKEPDQQAPEPGGDTGEGTEEVEEEAGGMR